MPSRRVTPLTVAAGVLLTWAVAAPAQDVKSGPQPDQFLPSSFHPYNVNGPRAGKYHCLVCDFGLNPVVAVFVRPPVAPNQPVANLLRKLDDAVAKNREARLHAFAVVLSDVKEKERENLITQLQGLVKVAKLNQVVVGLDRAAGPEDYNLSKDAAITVLVYDRHKVLANFAFARGKMTDKDGDAILAEVAKKLLPAKK